MYILARLLLQNKSDYTLSLLIISIREDGIRGPSLFAILLFVFTILNFKCYGKDKRYY